MQRKRSRKLPLRHLLFLFSLYPLSLLLHFLLPNSSTFSNPIVLAPAAPEPQHYQHNHVFQAAFGRLPVETRQNRREPDRPQSSVCQKSCTPTVRPRCGAGYVLYAEARKVFCDLLSLGGFDGTCEPTLHLPLCPSDKISDRLHAIQLSRGAWS